MPARRATALVGGRSKPPSYRAGAFSATEGDGWRCVEDYSPYSERLFSARVAHGWSYSGKYSFTWSSVAEAAL
jgi:hypothetical protein